MLKNIKNSLNGLQFGFAYKPERIAIVDTHGHLRGYFDGLNQNAASAVIDEISKLRSEKL